MKKYQIQVNPQSCTGCLLCELACSDLFTRTFNPSAARIRIELNDADFFISFTDDCNQCGTCADHCLYGALEKVSKEAGR